MACNSRAALTAAALALVLAAVPAGGAASPDSAPVPVWDSPEPFLALVLGIVDGDWQGRMTGRQVHRVMGRTGRESRIPLDGLSSLSRRKREGRLPAQWVVSFESPQTIPVPYSILGYHPGDIKVSRSFVLDEWKVGNFTFSYREDQNAARMVLEDVVLWALHPGSLFMDIDGWLDALLGDRLDDTHIAGFALFTHRGRRYVAALGYNRQGQGSSGVFDLGGDRIVYPYPPRFQKAAGLLRARLERLAPLAVLPYRRVGR